MRLTSRTLSALVLVLALAALGGCPSDTTETIDAFVPPPDVMVEPIDAAPPDAPIPLTFEAWVVDLVENRTADDTDTAADTEFVSLPESGDPAAFDSLFP
jgi:hypothetical protein